MTSAFGAAGRTDAVSVGDVAGPGAAASAGDAVGATGTADGAADRTTDTAAKVLCADKLPCLHQTNVPTPATKITATEAVSGSARLRRRLRRPG